MEKMEINLYQIAFDKVMSANKQMIRKQLDNAPTAFQAKMREDLILECIIQTVQSVKRKLLLNAHIRLAVKRQTFPFLYL